jgi:DNA-binding GntR family transcriptional regulator
MFGHDTRFHKAILGTTENETVIQAFEQAHCHLHLFRMYRDDWDWKASIEQHKAIAQAIANGDPAAAEEAMRNHLNSAYSRFIAIMPKDGGVRPLAKITPGKLIRK